MDVAQAPTPASCNPISDWVRGTQTSTARVEARALTPAGQQLLIVGAEAAPGDAELRAFYGDHRLLQERRIVGLEHVLDGAIEELRFALEPLAEGAVFAVPALRSTDDEFTPRGPSTLDGVPLDELPRTRLALEGLRFECSEESADGWHLSNDPPSHDPIASCANQREEFHCFSLPAGLTLGPDQPIPTEGFEVTISQIGDGVPPADAPEGCRELVESALFSYPEEAISWASFAFGSEQGIIALHSPGVPWPFAVGDRLRAYHQRRALVPDETLTLRESSGQLLLWSSRAAAIDEIRPPEELTLARGAEQCAGTRSCYYASQLGYDVSIGSETRSVAHGEQAAVGGYMFVNVGLDLPTAQISSCLDGDGGRANAELWATPAQQRLP